MFYIDIPAEGATMTWSSKTLFATLKALFNGIYNIEIVYVTELEVNIWGYYIHPEQKKEKTTRLDFEGRLDQQN